MKSNDDFPTATSDFTKYCTKCGHCVAACPNGAIRLESFGPEECDKIRDELNIKPEEARQFLRSRRSTRSFKKLTVPRTILEDLLSVACSAPSGKNRQPWHWIVVESRSEIQNLASKVIEWMRTVVKDNPDEAMKRRFDRAVCYWDKGYDSICRGAPYLIVVHCKNDWPFNAEDCALALGQLDFYATSIGLGTCWGGYFYKAVNRYKPLFDALGLPADHLAFGALMVGYPKIKYLRIPKRNAPRVVWK